MSFFVFVRIVKLLPDTAKFTVFFYRILSLFPDVTKFRFFFLFDVFLCFVLDAFGNKITEQWQTHPPQKS